VTKAVPAPTPHSDRNPTPMRCLVDRSQSQHPVLTGRKSVACLERLIPDSSRVFLDDVENDAFAAALRPVAD
jgi:hypothetical protein